MRMPSVCCVSVRPALDFAPTFASAHRELRVDREFCSNAHSQHVNPCRLTRFETGREYDIAVEKGVAGSDRAGHAVMSRDRAAFQRAAIDRRVHDDNRQRCR